MTAATLLLVGHGFPRRPQARHPAQDHAERLQRDPLFDEVTPALMKGEPNLEEGLRSIPAGRTVVVPLFVSDGYFVGEAIPDRVEASRPGDVTVEYAQPVGTHEDAAEIILRRALSAVDDSPTGVELALLGHGSEHGSANREAVENHARRIDERNLFSTVRSYFIEEAPHVERLPGACTSEKVVAVPVFMARGHHVREDIPEQLGLAGGDDAVEGTQITCTDPIGTDPMVADIAFSRAIDATGDAWREALDGTPDSGQIRRNTL